MKATILSLTVLLAMSALPQETTAKNDDKKDPVVFNIGGRDVRRSEFTYFYEKNNQLESLEGKTFDDYVDLFVNYHLKVAEGYAQGVDTMQAYKDELAGYRKQLAEPYLTMPGWADSLLTEAYEHRKWEVKASHLLLTCDDKTPASVVDSLYQVVLGYQYEVQAGTSFDSLARNFSQDPSARMNAGDLGYFTSLQMVYPFEQAAFNTPVGETTVVRSSFGWHLIKVFDKRHTPDWEELTHYLETSRDSANDIRLKQMLMQDEDRAKAGRKRLAVIKRQELMQDKKLRKQLVRWSDEEVMQYIDEHLAEMEPDFRNIYREYHDGLMLFDVSSKAVWDKAQQDTVGLQNFFEQHREQYAFTQPRFKGAFIECVDDSLLYNALKNIYDNVDAIEAADLVRQTILTDTILTPNPRAPRFHIINGLFAPGDNDLIDVERFRIEGASFTAREKMPLTMTYGRLLNAPENIDDVRGSVVADYQSELEMAWVAELKKKFEVKVNKKELDKLR